MIYSDFSVIKADGSRTLLTQITNRTFDIQSDFAVSTIQFSMTRDAATAAGVKSGSYLSVTVDDIQVPTIYVVEGSSYTYASDSGVSMIDFKGRSFHATGEDGVVLPSAWPNPVPSGHAFTNATAGTMVKTLVARAQERSTLLDWKHDSFTGTVDSNGVPWPTMDDRSFSNGDTILQSLQSLVSSGMVQLTFDGFNLRAYVPGTLGRELSQDKIFFRPGYSLAEGSVDTDISDFATDIFAIGEGSATALVSRPELYGTLGRRKMKFVQYGNISNSDLLKTLANADLDRYGNLKQEDSLSIPHSVYQPLRDYNIGDWVSLDRGDGTATKVQIKQISFQESAQDGAWSVGVSLGTLLDSAQEKIQRRLDAITGANSGGGAVPNDKQAIKMAPGKVAAISITALPYLDNQLRRKVSAQVDWSDVLTYSNGMPMGDVDHYDIAVKSGNATDYGAVQTVQESRAILSGYDPDTRIQIKVRAVNTEKLAGAWTESTVTTLVDNTPLVLAKPSTPSIVVRWQSLAITWDGRNSDGSFPSRDCFGVEVHLTSIPDFTPSADTRVGFLPLVQGSRVGGSMTVADLAESSDYYVRFVPVGDKGTAGTPSDIASATTQQLVVSPTQIAQINDGLDRAKKDLYDAGGVVDNIKTTLTGQIVHAQSTADAAQTSASGKSTVSWSQYAANDTTGPGQRTGDVWYQYVMEDGKMKILASWTWNGSSWATSALTETYLPQVNIGTGTYGELDGIRLKAKSVQANSILVEGSVDSTVIADGAITTTKLTAAAITGDKIAGNTITGNNIAGNTITGNNIQAQSVSTALLDVLQVKASNILSGNIVATIGISSNGYIIAGDVNGAHAELSSSGFKSYTVGLDGTPAVSTSLGTSTGDVLAVYNGVDLDPQASIAPTGDAAFNSVNSDNDIVVMGKSIVGQQNGDILQTPGWLDALPRGLVALGDVRTFISSAGTLPTGTTPIAVLGFNLQFDRTYRITCPVRYDLSNVSGTGRVAIGLKYEWSRVADEPDEPTTSSGTVNEDSRIFTSNSTNVSQSLEFVWVPANYGGDEGYVKVKVLVYAYTGSCQITPTVGGSGSWRVAVEDIGPVVAETARSVLPAKNTDGTTNKTPAKKTYTSTWVASASRAYYTSSGIVDNDFGPDQKKILRQGYYSSGTGDLRAAFICQYNAETGEAKSMSAALNGATITKAEVFLQSLHWWNSTGGTAYIRKLGSTSLPGTLPNSDSRTGATLVQKKYTTASQGQWITVPTSWFSNTSTGVIIGPTNTTSQSNYGYFAAHNHSTTSYRPRIRLTYTR